MKKYRFTEKRPQKRMWQTTSTPYLGGRKGHRGVQTTQKNENGKVQPLRQVARERRKQDLQKGKSSKFGTQAGGRMKVESLICKSTTEERGMRDKKRDSEKERKSRGKKGAVFRFRRREGWKKKTGKG